MSKPEQTASSAQGDLVQYAAGGGLPAEFARYLADEGLAIGSINVPNVKYYQKIAWEELCVLRTRDPNTLASAIVVVETISEFPDMKAEFDEYVGMVRIEFVTQNRERLSVSHSRCYSRTGEFLPLTEWVRAQQIPFAFRFGYVSTRREGRHVVKPLPASIEILL